MLQHLFRTVVTDKVCCRNPKAWTGIPKLLSGHCSYLSNPWISDYCLSALELWKADFLRLLSSNFVICRNENWVWKPLNAAYRYFSSFLYNVLCVAFVLSSDNWNKWICIIGSTLDLWNVYQVLILLPKPWHMNRLCRLSFKHLSATLLKQGTSLLCMSSWTVQIYKGFISFVKHMPTCGHHLQYSSKEDAARKQQPLLKFWITRVKPQALVLTSCEKPIYSGVRQIKLGQRPAFSVTTGVLWVMLPNVPG